MKLPWPLRMNVGTLLIGLGLLLVLTAAGASLLPAPPTDVPLDTVEAAPRATKGFEPIWVPASSLDQPGFAPTLPPLASMSATPPAPTPTSAAATRTALTSATLAAPTASPTPEPLWNPDRLVIPAIELDVPVVDAGLTEVTADGQVYQQWLAPNKKAVGWHMTSATLGVEGNTVLNGHHNVHGEVFGHLVDLKEGDLIEVYSGAQVFVYRIRLITILKERWQPLAVRLLNAQWLEPSRDERLTLVTCWPYTSNTHRLIIVAARVNPDALGDETMTPRLTPHPPAP